MGKAANSWMKIDVIVKNFYGTILTLNHKFIEAIDNR